MINKHSLPQVLVYQTFIVVERNLANLMSVPKSVPEIVAFYIRPVLQSQLKPLQSSANSLPSLVNRLGLNIRSQSYTNDLAFSSVSASI